jgi:hypothetical protein
MSQTLSELRHTTGSTKKTKVKVTASPLDAAPWVDFTMSSDYPDGGGKQDGDKLNFDAGAGAFELTFELRDDTKLGLAFYPDASDAIWAVVGTNKPQQGGFANGAIAPVSVADKKLVVTNDNSIAQTLNFILRFTGTAMAGGFPPYVLDPLIVNGGGGSGVSHD